MQQVIYGRVIDDVVGSDPRAPQFFSTPAGETGQVSIFVADVAGGAFNFSSTSLQLILTRNGNIVLSKLATISIPASGIGNVPLDAGDTINLLGGYRMEAWVTDASVTPNKRYQVIPASSTFVVSQALSPPNPPVTVGPTQIPLALGLNWRGAWSSSTGYVQRDAVSHPDPTAAGALSSFVCLVANTNVPPLSNLGVLNADWNYLAAAGGAIGSQSPNLVLASPASGAGFITARALVYADLPPLGAASIAGDVTGSLSASTVAQLQGRAVSSSAPSANQALVWGGASWAPAAVVNSVAATAGHINTSAATGVITLSLPNIGPGAGAQTLATGDALTLDAQGRVSAASTVTRNINTTTPITGGGSIASDLTLGLAPAGTAGTVTFGNGSITFDAFGGESSWISASNLITNLSPQVIGQGVPAANDTAASTSSWTGQSGGAAASVGGGVGGPLIFTGGRGGAGLGGLAPGAGGAAELLGGPAGTGGTSNANGGAIIVDSGTPSGTGTSSVFIATTHATTWVIGGSQVSGTCQITSGSAALTLTAGTTLSLLAPGGTVNLGTSTATTIGVGNGASATTLTGIFSVVAGNAAAADTNASTTSWTTQTGGAASATGGGNGAGLTVTLGAGGNGTGALNPGNGSDFVLHPGAPGTGGTGNASSGNVVFDVPAAAGNGTQGNFILKSAGTSKLIWSNSLNALYPVTDNAMTLGQSGNRYATVYALAHNSGSSAMTLASGSSITANVGSGGVFTLQLAGVSKMVWSDALTALYAVTDNSVSLGQSGNRYSTVYAFNISAAGTGQTLALRAPSGTIDLTNASAVSFPAGVVGDAALASTFMKAAAGAVGDLAYFTGTGAGPVSRLTDVAAGSYLRSGGTSAAPVWSTVTLPNAATTGDLWYASASNTMSALAGVAAGSFLRSGGTSTAPAWSTTTWPNAATTGDLVCATGSNAFGSVAAVATGQVLISQGTSTAPIYSANPTVTSVTITAGTGTQTGKTACTVFSDSSTTGSSTGGVIHPSSYTMPGNTLAANGQKLIITCWALHAANTNNSGAQLEFAGTVIQTTTTATSGAGISLTLIVQRLNSNTVSYTSSIATATSVLGKAGQITGLDFTSNITIQYTIGGASVPVTTGATANNDLTGGGMSVQWFSS